MSDSAETPARYRPDPRKFEDKAWLYEQYWGALRSTLDIAAECDVGHATIQAHLQKRGIPTRSAQFKPGNSVSAFARFYRGADAEPPDDPATESDDRDDGPTLDWNDVADSTQTDV